MAKATATVTANAQITFFVGKITAGTSGVKLLLLLTAAFEVCHNQCCENTDS